MSFNPAPTRRGYVVYDVVSAMQKAIRRSDTKQSVYWAMELWMSDHQTWMWNRLQEILSEDIGHADRYLPATIQAIREVSDTKRAKGKGGGMMEACHAVILLATAEKSGLACWLCDEMAGDHADRYEIPDEAKDMHTIAGKRLGRGPAHFAEVGQVKIEPDAAARERGFDSMDAELAQLEEDGLERWVRSCKKDPTLPENPWQLEKPAQNSQHVDSGQLPQLSLDGPIGDR